MLLPLLSLLVLCCALVQPVKGLPRHQNVTYRSPWMGEVSLLQYYHSVPDILVLEVNLYVCLRRCRATPPLNWAGHWPCLYQKRHLVHPGPIPHRRPRLSPSLDPPLPRRARFGGVQPVTP